MTPAMVVLEARALVKTYGRGATQVQALNGVDLSVTAGEFVAIMGSSGAGKSTLLQLLGGLDTPTAGTVRLAGRDLGALPETERTLIRRRHVGFVFQGFNLVPVLTAAENVALPLTLDGVPAAEAAARSLRMLALVGLGHRAGHLPAELSGGEQQRVAIARAMVTEPAVILADEPTGNLDSRTAREILGLLRRCVDDLSQTVVLVTHDPQAAAYADRIVFLRNGRVVDQLPVPGRGPAAAAAILARLEPLLAGTAVDTGEVHGHGGQPR